MSLLQYFGDLTEFEGDAIVNSLGKDLYVPGRICNSIYKKSGSSVLRYEVESHKPNEIGEVFHTKSFGLKCKLIIHVIMPYYNFDKDLLSYENAIRKVLLYCLNHKIHSVAFPYLGEGGSGYPKEEIESRLIPMIGVFADYYGMNIHLIKYNKSAGPASGRLFLNTPRSKIDLIQYEINELINKGKKKEEIYYRYYPKNYFEEDNVPSEESKVVEDKKRVTIHIEKYTNLSDYIHEYLKKRYDSVGTREKVVREIKIFLSKEVDRDLDTIPHKGISMYSQYVNENKKPSFNSLILIGLALRLNYDEMSELLAYNGKAFGAHDEKYNDLSECFKKEYYDKIKIEEIINKYMS